MHSSNWIYSRMQRKWLYSSSGSVNATENPIFSCQLNWNRKSVFVWNKIYRPLLVLVAIFSRFRSLFLRMRFADKSRQIAVGVEFLGTFYGGGATISSSLLSGPPPSSKSSVSPWGCSVSVICSLFAKARCVNEQPHYVIPFKRFVSLAFRTLQELFSRLAA